jgi:hypothetical protein
MAVGHFDMPPSLQWSEQHEQIGGTIALILVVVAGGLAWLCRDWDTRFLDLMSCFVVSSRQTTGRSGSCGRW